MPLIKSASNSAREENVHEMIDAGHPVNQAVAAAYHNQREAARHTHESRQRPLHEHERMKYGK